ncbi:hypothetical protein DSCW_30720 [Desulfosarcina widdelii]|uniref:Uncharacterized protein n=1 Tax=Desulfosarcina widdelii TaxID=947919 RepID=A0A5K7Z4K6_9BACT|nr:hypothetical protein DSCW_30720 [Desulfosarcina widdelii]
MDGRFAGPWSNSCLKKGDSRIILKYFSKPVCGIGKGFERDNRSLICPLSGGKGELASVGAYIDHRHKVRFKDGAMLSSGKYPVCIKRLEQSW